MFRHINRLLSLATLSSTAAFSTSSSRLPILNTQNNLLAALAITTSSHRAASSSSSSTSLTMMSSLQSIDTGYLNAQDAADLDVELMSTPGFSLEQLMELAGLSVAESVYIVGSEDANNNMKKKRVLLVCG